MKQIVSPQGDAPTGAHISPSPWELGVEGNPWRGVGVKGWRPGPRPAAGRAERGGRICARQPWCDEGEGGKPRTYEPPWGRPSPFRAGRRSECSQ